MAKRRGPLGQLLTGFILLVIVAAGAGVGVAVFYDDDALAARLRSLGLPDAHLAKIMDLKHHIKDSADFSGDDALFTARTIWWDLRDRFDLDLTSQVSLNLPPIRHVTQMEPMPRPDDPKEPAKEEHGAMPADHAPDKAPEHAAEGAAPALHEAEALPADIQREGGEQAGAHGAPMHEAAPEAKPEAAAPMETAHQDAPQAPEHKAAEPAHEAPAQATPAPEATAKPMDLTHTPAAKEEAPAAPEPAAQETAALPAAPAAPEPATAEERLAAADLTYKRALALFANAKTDEEKAEAAKLFAQAAIDGHPGAQYSIGVMHYNGTGVAKDYAKAAQWFGRAAEKSNAAAQYNLGILYYNGQGVPKDDKLAYKWISAAAENGDQKAIVARDALKKALPSDVTKPESPTFSAPPAGGAAVGTPLTVAPAK